MSLPLMKFPGKSQHLRREMAFFDACTGRNECFYGGNVYDS
jgi:hypothetical protein